MQILEDETCKECGNPIWICRNDGAQNVGFKVKTATCYAKLNLDKWQDDESKKKSSKPKFGQYPYVVAYTYDNSEMPSRAQFYREVAQKYKVE
jgi:hypothetical protein